MTYIHQSIIRLIKIYLICFLFIPSICISAGPIIGTYWSFAPCLSDTSQKSLDVFQSDGTRYIEKGQLYEKNTYRNELANDISKLLSHLLDTKICVRLEPISTAINNPNWWVLFPKPEGIYKLEAKKYPFSYIKEIAVLPNKDGTYCSNLVVKNQSKIYSMADLNGKEILIPEKASVGSYLYPNSILKYYFQHNNIRFKTGKPGDSKLKLVRDFFNSKQDDALLIWDNALLEYRGKYKSLIEFCGIPDYILISNDKFVSKKQNQLIIRALEEYHGKYISWVTPNKERLKAFFDPIVKDN